MCGIAGIVGRSIDPRRARRAVEAMVCSLARRGPDSSGVFTWPDAVLGHRRLAILDVSPAGNQPMLSVDGEIGLVFNGCIYNFQELRQELEGCGHRFRSNTDTEVLLHGYRQWGIDALVRRLRGMFAFGIWDNPQRRLTLVRDRLGVKPLVYAARNGQLGFASTISALREADLADQIDPAAVLEFLEFGWVSDDLAIYQGARKVPAATIVEWQDGGINERSYWTPPEPGSRHCSFDDAVNETEALLLEAVKLRLVADVPVGALLSGGIDSTLIAWAMAKLNANVKVFTVGTPGHPADESAAARETAGILGIPHETIELAAGDQPALQDLTHAYGEPFACSSALGMLQVSRAVKPKATVLLTGDGGDDVFLGYNHHRNFHYAQRLARVLPRSVARVWPTLRGAIARVPRLRRAMHLTDYAVGGLGAVTRTHDGLPYYEHAGLLGERLEGRQMSHRQIADSLESGRELMQQFLAYELRTRFLAEYMTKVDGGTMYYSIEARSPFLDQRMWEHAASLPIETRLRGNELKAILRALVRRNVGPQVASRKKQGFTVPVENWLAKGWRPQLDALLEKPLLEQQGWIRKGELAGAVATALGRGRAPVQLWSLVVLENWLRANSVKATVLETPRLLHS
jgi:asparagine synthase (glutamine-hydrolysing)